MTEYWVSTKKHYCEICNCWLSANKLNIRNHEKSAKHLENFRKQLKESSARREQETQDKEFLEKELKKLEQVEKQYLASLSKKEKLNKNEENKNEENKNIENKHIEKKNIEKKNTITNTANNYFSSVPPYSLKSHHPKQDVIKNEFNRNETTNNESDWLVMIDEDTGRLVYLNKLNNEMQNEFPKSFSGSLPKEEAFIEQNGWYRYFDFYLNNFYYYNVNTFQYIWQYSSTNINSFITRLKQWENIYLTNNYKTNVSYSNSSHSIYTNYPLPNYVPGNYECSGNVKENEMREFKVWHTKGQEKEKQKEEKTGGEKEKVAEKGKKGNEQKQHEKFCLTLNLNKQINETETEQKRTNKVNHEIGANNILMEEIKKKTAEKEQKVESTENNNVTDINNIYKVGASENKTEYIKNEKNKEHATFKKKRVSRWDQRYVQTEKEKGNEKKEQAEKENAKDNNDVEKEHIEEQGEKEKDNNDVKKEQTEMKEEIPKKRMKTDFVLDKEENKSDKQNEKGADETIGAPGEWEIVKNAKVHTIPNASVEDIFYKIKSKEQIEKEELLKLEENIKDEYSMYNEFYVKKKELENPDLFLNQEFQFVNKPVFIKATDKKNMEKEKVTFAKRAIKAKNKKGDISNAN